MSETVVGVWTTWKITVGIERSCVGQMYHPMLLFEACFPLAEDCNNLAQRIMGMFMLLSAMRVQCGPDAKRIG